MLQNPINLDKHEIYFLPIKGGHTCSTSHGSATDMHKSYNEKKRYVACPLYSKGTVDHQDLLSNIGPLS